MKRNMTVSVSVAIVIGLAFAVGGILLLENNKPRYAHAQAPTENCEQYFELQKKTYNNIEKSSWPHIQASHSAAHGAMFLSCLARNKH